MLSLSLNKLRFCRKIQSKNFKRGENTYPMKTFKQLTGFKHFTMLCHSWKKRIQSESCQTSVGQIVLAYLKGVYFSQSECHSSLPIQQQTGIKTLGQSSHQTKNILEKTRTYTCTSFELDHIWQTKRNGNRYVSQVCTHK